MGEYPSKLYNALLKELMKGFILETKAVLMVNTCASFSHQFQYEVTFGKRKWLSSEKTNSSVKKSL